MSVSRIGVSVLIVRALLFEVYIEAPDCWKLPYGI